MRCESCSAEIPKEAAFCGACGARVKGPRSGSSEFLAVVAPPSRRRLKIGLLLAVDVMLLGAGSVLLWDDRPMPATPAGAAVPTEGAGAGAKAPAPPADLRPQPAPEPKAKRKGEGRKSIRPRGEGRP